MTTYIDFNLKLFDKNPQDNEGNDGNEEKKEKIIAVLGIVKIKLILPFQLFFCLYHVV